MTSISFRAGFSWEKVQYSLDQEYSIVRLLVCRYQFLISRSKASSLKLYKHVLL